MLLFRSEEAAGAWALAGEPMAAFMTLDQCWRLSRNWYEGRLDVEYERRPVDHFQALLGAAGLTGDAWSLSPPHLK
jgi:hypothetical protein